MTAPAAVLALAIGALLGAVVVRPLVFVYTRPLGTGPSSRCPACEASPLVANGAVLLRFAAGRCAACSGRIGPVAGLPEVLTGVLFAVVALAGAHGWLALAQWWVVLLGVPLALIDLVVYRLPDHLTLALNAGVAVALAGAAATGQDQAVTVRALLAAVVLSVLFFGLALLGGVALGDFKMAPALGALLGWHSWSALAFGVLAGFVLGAVHGAGLLVAGKATRRSRIAIGPALIAGAVVTSLFLG
ncbi:A24 family peptidase [Kitasatospora sp. NPDC002227]|uniref:prepilin peptidase n=1 Tax=Kitasatospora sp. NPDC002227 TaxID=3154773 RepID=UPI00331E7067